MGWTYEIADTLHPEIVDAIESAIWAPFKGGAFIAETLGSAAGYATGITNGERVGFDVRFTIQILSQSYKTVLSMGEENPIKKITKTVLGHAKKSNPTKYAAEVGKMAIKMGVKKTLQEPFIAAFADFLAARIIRNHAAKKSISKGMSFAIGLGLTAASIYDLSFYAAMRLKRKNPSLYYELFNKNLECFWFIVEKDLEGFV